MNTYLASNKLRGFLLPNVFTALSLQAMSIYDIEISGLVPSIVSKNYFKLLNMVATNFQVKSQKTSSTTFLI